MKHRKRRRPSPTIGHAARRMQRQATQAQLVYDLARFSAETIGYRMAMLGQAIMGAGSAAHNPEIFTMVAEKMLAGAEAGAIAMRHIGPTQRAWAEFWFRQLQQQISAWHPARAGYAARRMLSDSMSAWVSGANLFDAALLSHTKPIHRTVVRNARRLRSERPS